MNKLKQLHERLLIIREGNVDESKFLNPITRKNPYYRSGVNDGILVAMLQVEKFMAKKADKC